MRIYPSLYKYILSQLPEQLVERFGGSFMNLLGKFIRTVDIPVRIGNLEFNNPLGISSGWVDTPQKMDIAHNLGMGVVTSKTITHSPRKGNPRPWIIRQGDDLINSMGLPNKGLEYWVADYNKSREYPSILSIRGENQREWTQLIERLENKVDIFELNFSCPNLADGVMDLVSSKETIDDIAGITGKRIWLKISPAYTPSMNLELINSTRDIIDGVTCMNTIPVHHSGLGNPTKQGGRSGRSVFPVLIDQLTCIRNEYKSHNELPIFAVGGIDSPERAWQVLSEFKAFPLCLTSFLTQGPLIYRYFGKHIDKMLDEQQTSITSLLS